jgi:Fe-S oxidoreductase
LGDIFHEAHSLDIHEYLLDKGVTLEATAEQYLYHTPCHDPIKTGNSAGTISKIVNSAVIDNDRCCGEAGSFAVARPDIAAQVKFKKSTEIKKDLARLKTPQKTTKILTTCPACRQGLARYRHESNIQPVYPIELIAQQKLGEDWIKDFVKSVNIEKVLF